MKKIILFIVFILFCSSAHAETKTLKINENNKILIDLNKNKKVLRLINRGEIKIELEGNKYLNLTKINNKIYLHINTINIEEEGLIILSKGDKKITVPYHVNYRKSEKNLDITNDFLLKRLQNKPLSCEISSTSDILSHIKGKNISENDLLPKLSKSNYNQLPYKEGDKLIWGNPNEGFVGYIDYYQVGSGNSLTKPTQRFMTGYGVYEKPIKDIYSEYGIESQIININNHDSKFTPEKHLEYVLESLYKGDMVQLWGDWCTLSTEDDGTISSNEITQSDVDKKIYGKNTCSTFYDNRDLNWYYYDNNGVLNKHIGLSGEHNFYLLGYKGTPHNPESIIVWDTNTGRHELSIKEWMRKWKKMDYRSLIIES